MHRDTADKGIKLVVFQALKESSSCLSTSGKNYTCILLLLESYSIILFSVFSFLVHFTAFASDPNLPKYAPLPLVFQWNESRSRTNGIQRYTLFERRLNFFSAEISFTGQIDGTFVIRKSNHGSEKSPYSMTLYFKNKTFNLNIRALPNSKFALGKKKRNEVVK